MVKLFDKLFGRFAEFKLGEVCYWKAHYRFEPVKVKIIDVYFDGFWSFSYGVEIVDDRLPDLVGKSILSHDYELLKLG